MIYEISPDPDKRTRLEEGIWLYVLGQLNLKHILSEKQTPRYFLEGDFAANLSRREHYLRTCLEQMEEELRAGLTRGQLQPDKTIFQTPNHQVSFRAGSGDKAHRAEVVFSERPEKDKPEGQSHKPGPARP